MRERRPILVPILAALLLSSGSERAHAATTVITNVIPNATQTNVSIYGQNFCTSPAPQVYMFIPPNVAAGQLLTVTSFGPTLITATLPAGNNPAGIYLFFVNCAGVFNGFAAVLDRPGVAGATGSTGTTGATGATGATGVTGSGANVSVLAPLASSGGPTPVLSLPWVRIDQNLPFNTASGYQTLIQNTTGSQNTASGVNALFNDTTGSYNTASGVNTLYSNTTGDRNTASGVNALFSNTGPSNTAIGVNTLFSNTTGDSNTASGVEALYNNTTGNQNSASAAIALYNNTEGSFNTASGIGALYLNTIGSSNTAIGNSALNSNMTGSFNTAIGAFSGVTAGNLLNATAIGTNAKVNASNKVRIGDTSVTVIEGQVAYTFTSDRNQKERFLPVDSMEMLMKLRTLPLTSWNYIGQDPARFRHYGPTAQDFFAAFGHDAVGTFGNDTTINSGDLAGVTLIAVQAVANENEQLKAANQELKTRLAAQEGRLAQLEAAFKASVLMNESR